MNKEITLIGGSKHRKKFIPEYYSSVHHFAMIPEIKAFNNKEIPNFCCNLNEKETYIRHYIKCGSLAPIEIYLIEGQNPDLWLRNLVLDYLR